tara:strand:+ start:67 stop:540 length:474 start_codon:yes stop_codon:yes gene_type:complete
MPLMQAQVEAAMSATNSNAEAARYLRVSYDTYKKYAKLYKKGETTLFEMHKNQSGKGISKLNKGEGAKYPLDQILQGDHPTYPPSRLKRRVLKELILEEKCSNCGFEEKRITDFTVPLLLDHIDGDTTNHIENNLRMLCYNCYYLMVKNPCGGNGGL